MASIRLHQTMKASIGGAIHDSCMAVSEIPNAQLHQNKLSPAKLSLHLVLVGAESGAASVPHRTSSSIEAM